MTDGRQIAVVLLLVVGVVFVLLGVTWKHWHSPQLLWSREQATEYTDAWRAYKVAATSGPRGPNASTDPKFAAAKARYDSIKTELDRAIAFNDYTGTVLAAAGVVVIAIGAGLLWSRGQSDPSAREV